MNDELKPSEFYNDVLTGGVPTDECIPWPYAKNSSGYARIRRNGKQRCATQLLLEDLGIPKRSPSHCQAAHSCHNRDCINPLHVVWATRVQNFSDKLIDGTTSRGTGNGESKLTNKQALNIFTAATAGTAPKDIVAKLALEGVEIHEQTVSAIKNGERWGWLTKHKKFTDQQYEVGLVRRVYDTSRDYQQSLVILALHARDSAHTDEQKLEALTAFDELSQPLPQPRGLITTDALWRQIAAPYRVQIPTENPDTLRIEKLQELAKSHGVST